MLFASAQPPSALRRGWGAFSSVETNIFLRLHFSVLTSHFKDKNIDIEDPAGSPCQHTQPDGTSIIFNKLTVSIIHQKYLERSRACVEE